MCASLRPDPDVARESFVPVRGAELFCREVGRGRPLLILHGGPDFDHTYLLPDLDRLADAYRLIYYDQRGRGRSRGALRLDDISIEQACADLDEIRAAHGLETAAMVGHSWGGHLALQYAVRYPARASHLVLMNTAPADYAGGAALLEERRRRTAAFHDRLQALEASAAYAAGDPEAVAERYRLIFGTTIKRPEHLARLNLSWSQADILRGRAVEDKLMEGLYWTEGFTLLPRLAAFAGPALLIHGDYDFIDVATAARIAAALPAARLAVLRGCGHFAYLEAPAAVRRELDAFFAGA